MDSQELVTLMKEWKDEMKAVNKDYHDAISALKALSDQYKTNWYQRNKEWLTPLIISAIFVTSVLILSNFTPCGEYGNDTLKIIKSCSITTIDKIVKNDKIVP